MRYYLFCFEYHFLRSVDYNWDHLAVNKREGWLELFILFFSYLKNEIDVEHSQHFGIPFVIIYLIFQLIGYRICGRNETFNHKLVIISMSLPVSTSDNHRNIRLFQLLPSPTTLEVDINYQKFLT